MSLSSFEFIPLKEELELLPFRCKDEDLNNFLFDDAKHYLAELMAVTYLFIDPATQQTVAYFSLLNDKVSYDPEEHSFWNRLNRRISNRKRRRNYPSVKIGRLAVSQDYAEQGIGREILNFIKLFSDSLNKKRYNHIEAGSAFRHYPFFLFTFSLKAEIK